MSSDQVESNKLTKDNRSEEVLVTQSYPTDCSPPGFSVHGILQARSGLPVPSPEDFTNPGIEPGSPALQADSLPFEL